jgi:SAM-dependent methyltransferase
MASTEARRLDAELMDEPGHPMDQLSGALAHVAAVNRWLGGERSLRARLDSFRSEELSLIDVGTGNGTTLRRVLEWGSRDGRRWRGVGCEISPEVLQVARVTPGGEPGHTAKLVRGNALELPFADKSFDVAISSLTLHHFGDDLAVQVLREMGRVARELVLVSDLERRSLSYGGARLLASTWWRRNPLTRNDGPLSVQRAFTARELAELGWRAGLADVAVERHFPFRLLLEGKPAETRTSSFSFSGMASSADAASAPELEMIQADRVEPPMADLQMSDSELSELVIAELESSESDPSETNAPAPNRPQRGTPRRRRRRKSTPRTSSQ